MSTRYKEFLSGCLLLLGLIGCILASQEVIDSPNSLDETPAEVTEFTTTVNGETTPEAISEDAPVNVTESFLNATDGSKLEAISVTSEDPSVNVTESILNATDGSTLVGNETVTDNVTNVESTTEDAVMSADAIKITTDNSSGVTAETPNMDFVSESWLTSLPDPLLDSMPPKNRSNHSSGGNGSTVQNSPVFFQYVPSLVNSNSSSNDTGVYLRTIDTKGSENGSVPLMLMENSTKADYEPRNIVNYAPLPRAISRINESPLNATLYAFPMIPGNGSTSVNVVKPVIAPYRLNLNPDPLETTSEKYVPPRSEWLRSNIISPYAYSGLAIRDDNIQPRSLMSPINLARIPTTTTTTTSTTPKPKSTTVKKPGFRTILKKPKTKPTRKPKVRKVVRKITKVTAPTKRNTGGFRSVKKAQPVQGKQRRHRRFRKVVVRRRRFTTTRLVFRRRSRTTRLVRKTRTTPKVTGETTVGVE